MVLASPGTITLPPLHSGGQHQVFKDPTRFKVLVCGRRWGKSLLAAVWLISIAIRGGVGWWVWPSFPMAMVGWRRLMVILAPLIAAKAVTIIKGERLIIFPGGGSIQMKSAERANSLRGDGLDAVVIDEWAYIRNGASVWESDLRPALSEKMGSAMLITTPKGMDHVYEYFHLAKRNKLYSAYHFPTWTNPFIPRDEIIQAKVSIPKSIFNQEYGALFMEDAASFFMNIRRVMKAKIQHRGIEGHSYRAGLDIGRYRDRTVLSIVDMSITPKEICYMEEYSGWPFLAQKNRILTTTSRFDVDLMTIDVTGMGIGLGERIAEDADFTTTPIVYTNPLKMEMFNDLHAAYENDELLIPNYEWLMIEHQMMVPQIIPGRLAVKIDARPGFYDDGVNSCALVQRSMKEAMVTMHVDDAEEEHEYIE